MINIKKIYVDAVEGVLDNTRTIETITFNDRVYNVDQSIPAYMESIGDLNCMVFLCQIKGKKFKVYCNEDYKVPEYEKYFTLK